MIDQHRVHSIKDLDSLLCFLRDDLNWNYPEAGIEDVSFEWTGLDLNLSEDIHKKLKGGLIRQLQPFATHQPWGIFVVEFATREVSIITLRQILRCFVAKRRGARPDLPAWQCENLLFICLYGENGFTFAHFKGDKPYSSKLTTFSWHPGKPIRTVCEFNLPALEYNDTWTPNTWVAEWQKAFDVEKVNKEFYRQIAQFYYRLTGKEGKKRELVLPSVADDTGSVSIYEEFAVRLIGRSIFCWFLKHKESEQNVPLIPPEVLSLDAAQKTGDFYHTMLEPLFFEVMNKPVKDRKPLAIPRSEIIPFLNGGLFEPHPYDFYPDAPNYGLKVPDAWFIDFFSLLERYNFTITENSNIDVDVAVDPEMLGRIFENLLAEVIPETGETARKATGSYYTPRAIVDYMVKQSLKQYLLTKTVLGEERVERLLDFGEDIEDFSPEEKLTVVTALREIKVIDPACGSGAFPMGILHRMLAVLEKVDPRLELWRAQYLKSLDGVVRQTVEKNISRENWAYIRKLMIIRDSIYGVDIQPIAVEIAKLRCFLSLVVDELVLDDEDNRGIEPLPNLEFKFVAANTLIGLPPRVEAQGAFGVSDAIIKLKELRESYLRSFGAEKLQIEKEFKATQQKLFKENVQWLLTDAQTQLLAEWDPFSYDSSGWFDPAWMFGNEGGFDIVVANPPYGVSIKGHNRIEVLNSLGKVPDYEIFYFFIQLSYKLLNKEGVQSYIIPNTLLFNVFAQQYRIDLLNRWSIILLVDCTNFKFFDKATIYNVITLFGKKSDVDTVGFKPTKDAGSFPELVVRPTKYIPKEQLLQNNTNWGLVFKVDESILALIRKIKTNNQPLQTYFPEISQGLIAYDKYHGQSKETIENRIFHHFENEKDFYQPWLRGEDVKKYQVIWNGKEFIDYCEGIANPREPKFFVGERILIREITNPSIYAAYTSEESYHDPSIIVIKRSNSFDIFCLLAILNSKLATFFHFNASPKATKGAFPKILVKDIQEYPLPHLQKASQDKLSNYAKRIQRLVIEKTDDTDEKDKLESQIDQLVYQLYKLTPEEIAVVEESLRK